MITNFGGLGLKSLARAIANLVMIGGIMEKIDYLNDPVFHRLQYEVRQAYELGFRAASNGCDEKSLLDPKKGKWFDHWIASTSRAFLIANGLMTGDEGYK